MNQPETDPLIPLKNAKLAAFLAFLVPGAGHFYQGRNFKGAIYFVCILTLFVWGMQMGEWKLVYRLEPAGDYQGVANRQRDLIDGVQFEELRDQMNQVAPSRENAKWHIGYFAQVPIGLFSIPAFIQEERFFSHGNVAVSPESIDLNEQVTGLLDYVDEEGDTQRIPIEGQLALAPEQGEFGREMQGSFEGTSDGQELSLKLRGIGALDPPIGADEYRRLACTVTFMNGTELPAGELVARVERSWINRFLVPPDHRVLEQLHGQMGKKFTLAEVFTWVAGLLNILAIWDAFAGPAYGYRMVSVVKSETEAEEPKLEPAPQTT